MKKFTLVFLIVLGSIATVFSQIPNGDFEQWTDFGDWEDPDGWYTLNMLYGGDPETVRTTGDAITGTTAVRMENEEDDNDNVVRAMMVSGGNSLDNHPGFSYNKRPSGLIGYFHYTPKGNDSCYIFGYLTRYNTSLQQRELIGSCAFRSGDEVDEYDVFTQPITYVSTAFPDTAYIVVYAGRFNGAEDGSRLILDALSFDESTTGITSAGQEFSFDLFPNPAKDVVTIQSSMSGQHKVLKIADLTGKTVKSVSIVKDQQQFSVGELENGFYFYQVLSEENRELKTGKLLVRR